MESRFLMFVVVWGLFMTGGCIWKDEGYQHTERTRYINSLSNRPLNSARAGLCYCHSLLKWWTGMFVSVCFLYSEALSPLCMCV